MTTILVTGAFGNVGRHVIRRLIQLDYDVVASDIKTSQIEKIAAQFKTVTPCWGDITKSETLEKAFSERIDGIIHLAFVIPPMIDKIPKIAEKVNIEGTRNLIEFLSQKGFKGPVVFSSSVSVFGYTGHETPPITVNHSITATDTYSAHKILCEKMFQESRLDWRILRYSAIMSPEQMSSRDMLHIAFCIPLHTRVEPAHVDDIAAATVNALAEGISRRIFIIAGGPENQTYWSDFFLRAIEPYVGKLSLDDIVTEKFSTDPYYLDWYDTRESERLLQYQHHTIDDYVQENYKALGIKRAIFWFLRPLIRKIIFH